MREQKVSLGSINIDKVDKALTELSGLRNAGPLKSKDFGESYSESLDIAIEALRELKCAIMVDESWNLSKIESLALYSILKNTVYTDLSEENMKDLIKLLNDIKISNGKEIDVFSKMSYGYVRGLSRLVSCIVLCEKDDVRSTIYHNIGLEVVNMFNCILQNEILERMNTFMLYRENEENGS